MLPTKLTHEVKDRIKKLQDFFVKTIPDGYYYNKWENQRRVSKIYTDKDGKRHLRVFTFLISKEFNDEFILLTSISEWAFNYVNLTEPTDQHFCNQDSLQEISPCPCCPIFMDKIKECLDKNNLTWHGGIWILNKNGGTFVITNEKINQAFTNLLRIRHLSNYDNG